MGSHFLQGKGMNRKEILKVNLKEVYRIEERDGEVLEGQVRKEPSAQGTGVVMKAKRPSVDFLAAMKAHGNEMCREREWMAAFWESGNFEILKGSLFYL